MFRGPRRRRTFVLFRRALLTLLLRCRLRALFRLTWRLADLGAGRLVFSRLLRSVLGPRLARLSALLRLRRRCCLPR